MLTYELSKGQPTTPRNYLCALAVNFALTLNATVCANICARSPPTITEHGGSLWIPEDKAKGGNDIHISLNDTAIAVLRRQLGKHSTRVFTYDGKPFNRAYTVAWQKALKRAGIENFRWHDLRHTWASWLAQNGVPLSDIQEMGGWETYAMVKRYAHLLLAHMAHRARVIDKLMNTNSAQSPNT